MNRHLETPKPWGASKQRAHGKAPWDGFLGCGILEKLERQHKRDPSPAGSCCWHPPAEQQEEPGRISNGIKQKGNWIERLTLLYLLGLVNLTSPSEQAWQSQAMCKTQRRSSLRHHQPQHLPVNHTVESQAVFPGDETGSLNRWDFL